MDIHPIVLVWLICLFTAILGVVLATFPVKPSKKIQDELDKIKEKDSIE